MERKVIIDRTKWARVNQEGKQVNGESALENYKGGMCCMGFFCKQVYPSFENLIREAYPSDIGITELSRINDPDEASLEAQLVDVNDRCIEETRPLTDQEQEDRIKSLFAQVGVEVEFVN
jgi:hypothetical protein